MDVRKRHTCRPAFERSRCADETDSRLLQVENKLQKPTVRHRLACRIEETHAVAVDFLDSLGISANVERLIDRMHFLECQVGKRFATFFKLGFRRKTLKQNNEIMAYSRRTSLVSADKSLKKIAAIDSAPRAR